MRSEDLRTAPSPASADGPIATASRTLPPRAPDSHDVLERRALAHQERLVIGTQGHQADTVPRRKFYRPTEKETTVPRRKGCRPTKEEVTVPRRKTHGIFTCKTAIFLRSIFGVLYFFFKHLLLILRKKQGLMKGGI